MVNSAVLIFSAELCGCECKWITLHTIMWFKYFSSKRAAKPACSSPQAIPNIPVLDYMEGFWKRIDLHRFYRTVTVDINTGTLVWYWKWKIRAKSKQNSGTAMSEIRNLCFFCSLFKLTEVTSSSEAFLYTVRIQISDVPGDNQGSEMFGCQTCRGSIVNNWDIYPPSSACTFTVYKYQRLTVSF